MSLGRGFQLFGAHATCGYVNVAKDIEVYLPGDDGGRSSPGPIMMVSKKCQWLADVADKAEL